MSAAYNYDQQRAEGWMVAMLRLGKPVSRAALAEYLRRADGPLAPEIRSHVADIIAQRYRKGHKGSGKRALTEGDAWLVRFVHSHLDTYIGEDDEAMRGRGVSKRAFSRMAADLDISEALLRKIWRDAPPAVKASHKG
jgi:hypothetical protein